MTSPTKRLAWLLGIGVTLTYLSLTPGVFYSMGYSLEEILAAKAILAKAGLENPVEGGLVWPRHGLLGLIAHFPFLIAGRIASKLPGITQEMIVAIEPVALTALLVVVTFLWSHRLSGSVSRAFRIAIIAGFCTMIWPYAYIGMELQQSLFLVLAAYLAIGREPSDRWAAVIGFGLSCGMAVSVKSTSLFLLPAIAFLLLHYFGRDREGRNLRLAVSVGITVGMLAVNAWTRSGYWDDSGGTRGFLEEWMVPDALAWALNAAALTGSPGKGLFVYAPVVLIAAFRLSRTWKVRRDIVIFALLTLAGLTAGFALFDIWSEETWGPRYLHSAIVPLIMIIAASPARERTGLVHRAPMAAAAVMGFLISFLGAIYSYGALHLLVLEAGRSTLETIQNDSDWNHIKFNARLFIAWMTTPETHHAVWTPAPTWYYEKPVWAREPKPLYLTGYSTPQPLLIRKWGSSRDPYWMMLLTSLIAGPCLLMYGLAQAKRGTRGMGDDSHAG